MLEIIVLVIIIDCFFVIFIIRKKSIRIQNKYVNMSEQTSQNKEYINTRPNSANHGITVSKEVTGIILI